MDNENQMTTLQKAIRQARKSKRITYEELAEMLDISPTHIKHIESGHRKPSIEILFEIARVLNLSLDGVVFPKDITQSDLTRGKIDRLLDSLDEDSLQFVLTVLEALHVKEQADG